MNVFISWSGQRSRAIAEKLHDWLPNVLQAVQPWMSAEDIDKGARWSSDIATQLEETRFGVICLTPENLEAPWILFEAGALSKTIDKTFVCPYLLDVDPTDIKGPLVQFQAAKANEEDTRKLILTINRALEEKALPENKVEKAFNVWWPELESGLASIPLPKETQQPKRQDREILEEILELVRTQTRESSTPTEPTLIAFEPSESSLLHVGVRVRHSKYGVGVVLREDGKDEDRKLTVSFPGYGLKKFIAKYSNLAIEQGSLKDV